ncbi:hypothetical protein SH661x_003910 [Planctomicrobium sp. SH661]|uniref:hypothetical protein n=1 Tax=Planctomicrobium sp. SH661 TaxID=3448124 RepID=UPI003F5C167F
MLDRQRFRSFWLALPVLCSSQLSANEPVPPLIQQLGDAQFHRRVEAEKILLQQGSASLNLIEAGVHSSDPEIRQRSLRLLEMLRKTAFHEQRDRVLNNPWTAPLELAPAWEVYQSICGDGQESRELYVRMIEEEGGLMLAVALHPGRWTQEFERRCADLRTFVDRRPSRELAPVSVLTLLFLADHPENKLNVFSSQTISTMLIDSAFYNYVQSCSEGEKKVCRALLSEWVRRSGHTSPSSRLDLATKYQLPAGVEAAREIIANRNAVGASRTQLQNAIRFITTYRPLNAVNDLEPLLNSAKSDLPVLKREPIPETTAPKGAGTQVPEHQISDLALLGLLQLTGQDPDDYGFTSIRIDVDQRFNPNAPILTTDETRRRAMQRWQTWRAAHSLQFTPPPEDASEGWAT